MARRRRRLFLVLGLIASTALLAGGGCAGSSDDADLVLDGRPRFPDAEGVAVSITHQEIVLDGDRRFEVAKGFRSFSTYTLALEPMLNRKGQYVQLGVVGGKAVWMAGIGGVLHTDPPKVLYEGRLVKVEDARAIFRDGTVLRLGAGVAPPDVEDATDADDVVAEIDPDRGVVSAFSPTAR